MAPLFFSRHRAIVFNFFSDIVHFSMRFCTAFFFTSRTFVKFVVFVMLRLHLCMQ